MGLFTSFQLKSRDAETRRRAALKLGTPGRTASIPTIRPLLDDPEWSVREAAVRALGAIGDSAVAPLLLDAVRHAEDAHDAEGAAAIRRAAVAGLIQVGSGAHGPLLEALRDRDARLREAAIEALGGVGGPDSVTALTAALGDDRSNVRQAAAPALARAGGVQAVPALRAALSHKDPATRRAAALSFGSIGDAASAEALRAAVGDRDRPVREAAVQSLAALRNAAAVDVLCAARLEGDREVKASAASALRSFEWNPAGARQHAVHAVLHGQFLEAAAQGGEAVAPLIVALTERDAATRRGAADALGALDDPRVVTALAPLLADQDAGVREAAVQSLARKASAASSELVRTLGDRDPAREAAAKAVGLIGERLVASAIMAPLLAGQPARHGGLALRVVGDRDALDEARRAADLLEILVRQLRSKLPSETLQAVAALDDVMLIEPGQRPDPDERVACDEIRGAAQKELDRRAN